MDGSFGSPTAPGRAIEEKPDAKQDLAVGQEKWIKAKNAMSLFARVMAESGVWAV